jgi:divalent metal cation (Fe/Co/Zn/Cd) transporter
VYEGILHVLNPRVLSDPIWVYLVLALAFVFEGSSWMVALRELSKTKGDASIWRAIRNSKDPAVYTVLAEDSAALVGLLFAFFGVLLTQITGNSVFDGVASIIIGCILATVAMFLAYETRSLLVGESDPEVARTVRRLAASDPAVRSVGAPLTMQLGPDEILVNLGVKFREGIGARELAGSIDRIERAIRREHPQVTRVFIEAEPLRSTEELPAAAEAATSPRDER